MKKDKLKILPFTLFFCLTSGVLPYFMFDLFTDINAFGVVTISLFFYLFDVRNTTENMYLEEKTNKLSDIIEELEKQLKTKDNEQI